ncbi:hypothetical protein AVEN_4228-1 [Araneus ventricosus]|uniref:Uncharacterized protein n=1 Tax=Araneus ventricosus TaxID=182803 RepID=A0A4Y2RYI5_ARAVE|nr:hypothetical protein AVEN_4228-1 [Araneus ventricosus]
MGCKETQLWLARSELNEKKMRFLIYFSSFHRCHKRYSEEPEKLVEGTVQSGGASVMVWDMCSWRDMGPLIRLETTLTGDRYLSIMPDHLQSTIPAGQCDTPRVESYYQVAPGTLF